MAKKVVIEDFSERKIKGKRAVIYARYSSAKQNEMSIEQQIGECGQYIEKQGYDGPLYFYSDMAKSASKDVEKRVEFLQMLEDVKNNKFDVVVAYAVDRISRDEDDAYYDYENELKKCGVRLEYSSQHFDEDSEDGGIIKAIYVKMAQIYIKKLRRDSMRGMRANAEEGLYNGGSAIPLGYKVSSGDGRGKRKKYLIDEDVAPFIKEAFEMYISGKTTQDIADYLNENGLRTARGNKISRDNINRMIGNALYKGTKITRFDNKEEHASYSVDEACEAIVDEKTWEKAQLEKERRSYTGQSEFHRETYLLTGKLFCGKCGAKMVADAGTGRGNDANKTPHEKYYYYACNNRKNKRTTDPQHCDKKRINKEKLEDTVIRILTDEFWSDEAIDSYHEASQKAELVRSVNPKIKNLKKSITEHKEKKKKAMDAYLSTDDEDWLERSKEEAAIIKDMQTALDALLRLEKTRTSPDEFLQKVHEIKKVWDVLCETTSGRLEIINRFIDRIIVNDPEDPKSPDKFKIKIIIKMEVNSNSFEELEAEVDSGEFENDDARVTKREVSDCGSFEETLLYWDASFFIFPEYSPPQSHMRLGSFVYVLHILITPVMK